MGKDFFQAYGIVREVFELADRKLGFSISQICFEGPEDTLKETAHAQLGIFVLSYAIFKLLQSQGISPSHVMGHSLGELTAYVAADVLDFETGLDVVRLRSQAMAVACAANPGAMAAVLGGTRAVIDTVIAECDASESVWIANYNSPLQIVLSGDAEKLRQVSEALKQQGVRRVVPLPVSGAFHSPFMALAADQFRQDLEAINFRPAQIPVVLNRTALAETEPNKLKENLPLQVISQVNWVDSLGQFNDPGNQFLECGPGKVLSGLLKSCLDQAVCENVSTVERYLAFLEQRKGSVG